MDMFSRVLRYLRKLGVAGNLRLLLGLAAAALLLWSFFVVGARVLRHVHPAGKKITLTVLHWGSKQETQIVRDLLRHYRKTHPKLRIRRIHANAYGTKLRTMFSAGAPPDLFYLSYSNVPEFAHRHLALNLSPEIAKERAAGHFKWFSDFYPKLLNAFRYAHGHAGKGPLYALPKDCTTLVMYVNTQLFHWAGVKVPYNGWTWKQYQRDMAAITKLNSKPRPPLSKEYTSAGRIYGGMLTLWPMTMRNVLWSYGGGVFKPGSHFKQLLLGGAADQRAMRMVYRLRFKTRTVYNSTGLAKSQNQEFFTGNIGCIGPLGRWLTPVYRGFKMFRWDVVPVPHGVADVSAVGTVGWAIARTCPHPRQAFKLLKYLCGPAGQAREARLGLAIPSLKSVAQSSAFLSPGQLPKHTDVFLKAMKHIRIARNPPQKGQFNQYFTQQLEDSLQMGQTSTLAAAGALQRQWGNYLNAPLQTKKFPTMPWAPWMEAIFIVGAIAAIAAVALVIKRREKGSLAARQTFSGYAFISPWVIGFLAFALVPMIVSLLLSFTKWSALEPISGARYVGATNYRQIFSDDPVFWKSLRVTCYFALLSVPLTQVAALGVALLMNLRIRAIGLFRTIYFVPSVVSGVALATLWLLIFNNDYGLMNALLAPLTHLFGAHPPDWFGLNAGVWAIPAFVIMGLWGVGSGMVIYLAGLKGVPASLYEAATIDGAGPVRCFFAVTIPMLSPLLFYNLVMSIIGSFQVFTQAQVMTQGGPNNDTLFYVLYLYQQAFEAHNMGYASALAWILFVIVLLLTLLVFRASRNWVYYEGLKT